MTTEVLHVKYRKGPDDGVYVGRAGKGESGKFGSPIRMHARCDYCDTVHDNAGDTIPCYELYLQDKLAHDADFREAVRKLDGQRLFCFCVTKENPDAPCHGRVLAKYAAELNVVKTVVRKKQDSQ